MGPGDSRLLGTWKLRIPLSGQVIVGSRVRRASSPMDGEIFQQARMQPKRFRPLITSVYRGSITRFEKAQAVALATALGRSTLEWLVTPSTNGGQRVPGLRVGAPRTMRILATLGCAGLSFKAFSNAEFRTVLVGQMGAAPQDATPARVGYELRKLRGKGLIRKVAGRNRYALTDLGYRTALALTKLHQRLLVPTLDSFDPNVRKTLGASPHVLDQALARLDADFNTLAQLCGLQVAA